MTERNSWKVIVSRKKCIILNVKEIEEWEKKKKKN